MGKSHSKTHTFNKQDKQLDEIQVKYVQLINEKDRIEQKEENIEKKIIIFKKQLEKTKSQNKIKKLNNKISELIKMKKDLLLSKKSNLRNSIDLDKSIKRLSKQKLEKA